MARRLTLDFLKTESGAGLILAAASAAALVLANSPWAWRYFAFVSAEVPVRLGEFAQTRSLFGWVRDGLMTVFFLVVGMEIKFEVLRGELASPRRLALPAFAALGGIVAPGLLFAAVNLAPGGRVAAWPAAGGTDIALALAVLALAAPRMPSDLRVLLLTVAIADNLAAVGLAALIHPIVLHRAAATGAGAALAAIIVLSRWRRTPFFFYAAAFTLTWAFTVQSGLDPALAGVACALTVPVGTRRAGQESVLKFFMDSLHPYVAFAILPLFAFTAAGLSLSAVTAAGAAAPVSLGFALALFVGKPLGVFAFAALAIIARLARRPAGVTWLELFGVAALCGVSFSMSLFVGLPMAGAAADPLRAGVIAGSALAALAGGAVLFGAQRARTARGDDAP